MFFVLLCMSSIFYVLRPPSALSDACCLSVATFGSSFLFHTKLFRNFLSVSLQTQSVSILSLQKQVSSHRDGVGVHRFHIRFRLFSLLAIIFFILIAVKFFVDVSLTRLVLGSSVLLVFEGLVRFFLCVFMSCISFCRIISLLFLFCIRHLSLPNFSSYRSLEKRLVYSTSSRSFCSVRP